MNSSVVMMLSLYPANEAIAFTVVSSVKISGRLREIKPKINYSDNENTNEIRKVVTDYNQLLAKTYIDIDVTGYVYKRKVREADRDNQNKQLLQLQWKL